MTATAHRRRFFAPEVVQTSAMDCGPAALKSILEGFRVPVSYGRLREACQTDVDGTSIDTLEEVARSLGLDAEQTMVPVDHLLLPEAEALPALVVVRLPGGLTHFLVVWRRHGPWVELMDPAVGRRWTRVDRFLEEVYVHELEIPAADWRAWARTEGFQRPLARRLRTLGLEDGGRAVLERAVEAEGWRSLAKLDAAARLVAQLIASGALRPGAEAATVLEAFLEGDDPHAALWSARPTPAGVDDGPERLVLRGAVLLRVRGLLPPDEAPAGELSRELRAALAEPPPRPGRELFRRLREHNVGLLCGLAAALVIAAGTAVIEAMVLRGAMDAGRDLGLLTQRLGAAGAFLVFALAVLLLELRTTQGLLALGRRLEALLRVAFLEKIPRLADRYFQSRPISDMAERSHSLQRIRELPRLAGQLLRAAAGIVVTAAGIALVDIPSAPVALAAAAAALALPFLFKPTLEERDLRVKTHSGALGRFYFDALLGLAAVRAHGAERSLRREHESLLVEWSGATRRLLSSTLLLEGAQATVGYSLAFLIVFLHASRGGNPSVALLLAYWALLLPTLGDELAFLVRQYPTHRSATLRLLEPLGAPEEERGEADGGASSASPNGGAAIELRAVSVRAAGHAILEDVSLHIAAGEHVALVGPSGSGKSSLVGLLLGWHRPHAGAVLVDGEPLDPERLERLRRDLAWVEPTIQLWNRSLLDNVLYGTASPAPSNARDLAAALEAADLYGLPGRLPAGLQTPLGEGGGLLSGGEGQRVRLGRGLYRPQPRLVILDEPVRGLDREQRRRLLDRARARWRGATLICITHDVRETLDFDRVIVLDSGRLVEDSNPRALANEAASRYAALLRAEDEVRAGLWSRGGWRQLRLESGRLREEGGSG